MQYFKSRPKTAKGVGWGGQNVNGGVAYLESLLL